MKDKGLWTPHGLCHGGELCGLYSAVSQDGKLVWGLCFGKVGGVISCLFGPVRGHRRTGPQCLLTPFVSTSSYIWSISPVLSGVLCEFKYALSNSLSPFLFFSFSLSLLYFSLSKDMNPRTMLQDYLA